MKYIQYLILAVSSFVYADDLTGIDASKTGLPGPKSIGDVTTHLTSVIGIIQDITAIIAVIGICLVGIMYIMSHGSEEKTDAAKKYMIHIVLGVLLAFAAWGIMSLINVIPNDIIPNTFKR